MVVIGMTRVEAFLETVAARQTIWPPGIVWPLLHDTYLSPLTDARTLFLQITIFFHKESHVIYKIITNNRFLICELITVPLFIYVDIKFL